MGTTGSSSNDRTGDWKIFHGDGRQRPVNADSLPEPPPWRQFDRLAQERATTFRPPPSVVEIVNAAIYLRRPLLVTGDPGTGKSSLAYAIAHELALGTVLTWHINSRSSLGDSLYQYDALARLREANLERARAETEALAERALAGVAAAPAAAGADRPSEEIGRFITLGPLGTAFVAEQRPRVVLIDEIDKSDIDLPNDLLHVLEDGWFEIPELARIAGDREEVLVQTADPGVTAAVRHGRITCRSFPIIVITSNGERDLPPAFLRRCLRVDIRSPGVAELREIVSAHFDHLSDADRARLEDLLTEFEQRRRAGALLATDQLLNAFFVVTRGSSITDAERAVVEQAVLRRLDVT